MRPLRHSQTLRFRQTIKEYFYPFNKHRNQLNKLFKFTCGVTKLKGVIALHVTTNSNNTRLRAKRPHFTINQVTGNRVTTQYNISHRLTFGNGVELCLDDAIDGTTTTSNHDAKGEDFFIVRGTTTFNNSVKEANFNTLSKGFISNVLNIKLYFYTTASANDADTTLYVFSNSVTLSNRIADTGDATTSANAFFTTNNISSLDVTSGSRVTSTGGTTTGTKAAEAAFYVFSFNITFGNRITCD